MSGYDYGSFAHLNDMGIGPDDFGDHEYEIAAYEAGFTDAREGRRSRKDEYDDLEGYNSYANGYEAGLLADATN